MIRLADHQRQATPVHLALAVALAFAVLMATAQDGADQPETSPDPMTYEGDQP